MEIANADPVQRKSELEKRGLKPLLNGTKRDSERVANSRFSIAIRCSHFCPAFHKKFPFPFIRLKLGRIKMDLEKEIFPGMRKEFQPE